MMENINDIQESQWTPSRINSEIHIDTKLSKAKKTKWNKAKKKKTEF